MSSWSTASTLVQPGVCTIESKASKCDYHIAKASPLSSDIGKLQSPVTKSMMTLNRRWGQDLVGDLDAGIERGKTINWRDTNPLKLDMVSRHAHGMARILNTVAKESTESCAQIVETMLN